MVNVNPFNLIGARVTAPPAPGYSRGTRVTAPNGHYLDFSTAVTWGLFTDEMPWFIPDGATITGRFPAARTYSGNTIDGFTLNPTVNGNQGLDQRHPNYVAAPSFPITPKKMDVLLSVECEESTDGSGGNEWRDGYFKANGQAWFTSLTKPPAAGTFSPTVHWPGDDVNRPLRPMRLPDIDAMIARMPNYSTSGVTSPPAWSTFASTIDQPNAAWLKYAFSSTPEGHVGGFGYEGFFPRRFGSPSNYGYYHSLEMTRACMAAALNHWSTADKRAFLVRMLQHGNQWIEPMQGRGAKSIGGDGGHWNWHWAAVALWLDATGQNARSAHLLGVFPGNLEQIFAITAGQIASDLVPHDDPAKSHAYRRREITAVSGLTITLENFRFGLGDGTWPEFINTIMTRVSDGDTSRHTTSFNPETYVTTTAQQASPVWAVGDVVYHAAGYTITPGMVFWSDPGTMSNQFTPSTNPIYSDLQAWAGQTLLLSAMGIIAPEFQNVKTYVANCATGTYPAAPPYNFNDSRKTTLETQVWNAHWAAASAVPTRF